MSASRSYHQEHFAAADGSCNNFDTSSGVCRVSSFRPFGCARENRVACEMGRFGGIGDLELSGGSITMVPGNTGNITLGTTPGSGVIHQSGGRIDDGASQRHQPAAELARRGRTNVPARIQKLSHGSGLDVRGQSGNRLGRCSHPHPQLRRISPTFFPPTTG